jgi:hypothetical protein
MAVIKIVPMPGAVGDKGDEGAVGPQGPQGATGEQGPSGADALWSYNGPWQSNASYAEGDVVTYQGQLYYVKSVTTAGTLPTDTSKFDLLAAKGADGEPGLNGLEGEQGPQGEPGADGTNGADALWNYTGEYNGGASYAVGDLATYDGQLWYRANANGGNVGDTPSQGYIWNLLAAKGTDGTNGSGGLVYLGNYILGNGYVTDLAVVRGSDNNLYIAKANGGLADPVGNTAEWDIFSTNTGGGTADLGDFEFTAGTATVNDNQALILQSKTPTAVKSQLFLNPYGVAKLEAFDNPNVTTFSAANPDWDSATWSVEPGVGSVIQFVNAPNILNWIGSLTTSVYDASLVINGVAAGTVNGFSYSGTDATLFINNTVPTEDPTVNEIGFVFVTSSFISIDYDDESFDIEAKNMDINIESDDDIYITAGGDDLFLRAGDDIRITSNYNDPSGETSEWRMDSEGEFHLPGQGLIWNPSNSSGDGYSGDTIHLVPNDSDNETEQRIIIDPTGPNHIHLRAGGVQDYSTADLILGGERAGVRVSDTDGTTVVQSKQEDYSWSYQNVGEGGQIYVIASAMAEPDINDFTIIGGQKYVITSVIRDEPNGITSYETTPSIGFIPFENYTFIRDRGNHAWNFNRQGYLSGPTETGHLRVTGIINDDGNLEVQADQNLIISGGESNGEYLHDSSDPANQIATIGDLTIAVGVGGNGEVTRWSPNFTATGLTFTGTGATHPTYNSHYVKNGRMVSFWIEINLATVTNFGTGQYITALPYAPLTGTMNHFQAWANVDPTVNPDIAGHVVLQADHLANTTALDLHYLKQAGGANSPLMEAMFTQGAPATLTTSSKIYINGTYITAE